MDVLQHGVMPTLFGGIRAPSTLGSFLRSFSWGSARQAEQVSRELLAEPAGRAPLLPGRDVVAFTGRRLDAETCLRPPEAGRRVRPHTKIQGKSPGSAGAERAGRYDLHAAGGAGDRGCQAARRQRGLRPGRRVVCRRIGHYRPCHRMRRDAGGAGRARRSTPRRSPERYAVRSTRRLTSPDPVTHAHSPGGQPASRQPTSPIRTVDKPQKPERRENHVRCHPQDHARRAWPEKGDHLNSGGG
jgi:hypothetical protein